MSRASGRARAAHHPLTLPTLIAAATVGGLVAGLVGDGGWDIVAALGLGTPLSAMAICVTHSRARGKARRSVDVRGGS